MATLNELGYLERVTSGAKTNKRNSVKRAWWLVQQKSKSSGEVHIKNIILPACLIGRRVMFKIEVIDDDGGNENVESNACTPL